MDCVPNEVKLREHVCSLALHFVKFPVVAITVYILCSANASLINSLVWVTMHGGSELKCAWHLLSIVVYIEIYIQGT